MKNNYFRLFLLSMTMTISSLINAQEWVEMMKNPNANFYETQAAFESYWAGKTIQKGKGYKAFKRWEYYMKPRVYPSGDVTLPSKNYTNYKQWEADLAAQGIPKSTNGNWTIIGPIGKPSGGGAGRLNFIRFDPTNSNTIWVGAPDGGLWKTTNGGTNWTTNTDQLTTIGVSDVAIDPTNTQIMYLATGDNDGTDTYSIGLLKSTDGGNTWNTTGLTWATTLGRTIGRVLVNPNSPQNILVFSSAGIFRSTNGGSTFSAATGTFACIDGEFKPGDPNTVYACGTTFKRSTDGGATWTAVTLPLTGIGRLSMAVSANNANYVYLLAANNTDNGYKGLMRSTNSGTSFTSQSTTPNVLGYDTGNDAGGQGWYDLAIAASPTNAEEIIIGGINHWRSTNGGTSWTQISHWYGGFQKPYVHADVHDIQFLPGSGSTIFSANDGGFFKTTNSGGAWTDLSSNLAIAQQYRFSLSSSSASMILAGHQDNGTNRTTNLTAWTEVGGGDGMDCFIDRTNNNRQIASVYYGDYSRTLNGGTFYNSDIADPAGQGEWVSPIHQDPVDPNIAYTGGRAALYKSSNIWASTVTWTTMGTPQGTGSITEFAIAPSNNQVIYALKDGNGGISKSTNGGTSFTSCATPTTAASPSWVAISNTDPNVVFVVYSGYSATNKVKKSINGGTSWTDLSTGLPNVPVNCVVYHNGAAGGDGIYIGTDVGVYYRDNSTNGWIDFSSGLPNCAVTDLEIYYPTNRLRAATFGRGSWDSDLYSSVPTAPVASFTATNTTICVGQSVQFTNTSTGQPTSFNWTFTGGTPSTSTAQNPTVTYNTAGTYDVSLTVSNANGSNTSTQTGYITVLAGTGTTLPLTEGFTNATFPPTGWTIINVDLGDTTWRRATNAGNTPTTGNSAVFLNFAVNDVGNQDELRTPKLNFTGLSAAQMTFDVAYAAYNATYVDGLQVLITTDCGTTWTSLYNKTGSTVAAGNLPTANALTSNFVPTSNQWRTETINLNSYINNTNVQLAFRNLAGYGNNLYIDNINITGTSVPTPPTASFTSTPSGASCTGQTVQYTSTSSGSPTSYSWSFPGGTPATSTVQNPTVTYNTAGTYNVSLTVTNSLGNNTSNQTNFITINQTPSITGTTPASRCGAGSVSLAATSSSGTISWYSAATGGTALATGTLFTTPSINTNTTYYVEVTANGCTSARTAVVATINLNPTVTAPANQNVCLGASTNAINFTGNSGNTTYNWANSNTAIGLGATGTGNITSFSPSATGTSSITVTPSLGSCTGSPVTFTITVNPPPSVTFDLSGVSSPCSTGSSISLPAGSPAGGTYSGTGVVGNTFNPTTSGVGTFPITYSVTQNGCTGSAVSSITVTAPPTVTFDLSTITSPCLNDPIITLPAGSPTGGTYSGPGVTGNSFNPAAAGVGTHTIVYSITQNGCTGNSNSSITVDACSNLDETNGNMVVIYPNPTSGLLSIQGLLSEMKNLELIDASGRICGKWNVNSTEMQIDLSTYATGSYTLKFIGGEISFVKRIEVKR